MTPPVDSRGAETDKLETLKAEYIANVERHSSLDQPYLRKRVNKCKTLKALKSLCDKDAANWFREGEEWDHPFYTQWGYIAQSISDQIPAPRKANK